MNIVQPSLPSSKIAFSRQPEGDSLAEPIHVLLVDDERLSRVVVGNLLRKCNYRGSFAWAVEALDRERSKFLILPVVMQLRQWRPASKL